VALGGLEYEQTTTMVGMEVESYVSLSCASAPADGGYGGGGMMRFGWDGRELDVSLQVLMNNDLYGSWLAGGFPKGSGGLSYMVPVGVIM